MSNKLSLYLKHQLFSHMIVANQEDKIKDNSEGQRLKG